MYGLKQAAIIAYNQLICHMKPQGYYPVPFTTGIWAYKTIKKTCLCVDDFGLKYFSEKALCNFNGLEGTQLSLIDDRL